MKSLTLWLLSLTLGGVALAQTAHDLTLWYQQPAKAILWREGRDEKKDNTEWLKALPLGNGFLGAMVFGDVDKERIQLNEKSLWSGSPFESDNPNAYAALAQIRELLFAGKYKEAEQLTHQTQVCSGAGTGYGNSAGRPYGCYQTLGDLWLNFGTRGPYRNYKRWLSLNDAMAHVQYTQNGITYYREAFINAPTNVMVIRLWADKQRSISLQCALTRPERFSTQAKGMQLLMQGVLTDGKGGEGMHYMARLQAVLKGGRQQVTDTSIDIKMADEVVLYFSAATDYVMQYPHFKGNDFEENTAAALRTATTKGFAAIKKEHLASHHSLFNRVGLQLANAYEPDTIPTDVRVERMKQSGSDNYLTQLYFQFGRYLLISSTRPNSLPANLQGIWADRIQTPWNSDYHTNINVQMNYWPAEVTNLSELHESLTRYIKMLSGPGAKTAAIQYHAPGWCVHTVANPWGFTSPGESPDWGLSLGTLGWLCQHIWEHYAFTQDIQFLKEYYPVLLQAALFYENWLVPSKEGQLVSGPASSPENAFIAPGGIRAAMSMGPSHDQEIIDELFGHVLSAALLLHVDKDTNVVKIKTAKAHLLRPQIAADGRLMEWAQPFEETELGHRHLSHLYGFYPGYLYSQLQTPDFARAVRKSLEVRLQNGLGYVGWSGGWVSNLWARFGEGDKALQAVNNVLATHTAPNLFDIPPFQIDGNMGVTAGIAEMLLQSHQGFIDLLPALPSAWSTGEVKGLCARGAFVVDMTWVKGQLTGVVLHSKNEGSVTLHHAGRSVTLPTRAGASIRLNGQLEVVNKKTKQAVTSPIKP